MSDQNEFYSSQRDTNYRKKDDTANSNWNKFRKFCELSSLSDLK